MRRGCERGRRRGATLVTKRQTFWKKTSRVDNRPILTSLMENVNGGFTRNSNRTKRRISTFILRRDSAAKIGVQYDNCFILHVFKYFGIVHFTCRAILLLSSHHHRTHDIIY